MLSIKVICGKILHDLKMYINLEDLYGTPEKMIQEDNIFTEVHFTLYSWSVLAFVWLFTSSGAS